MKKAKKTGQMLESEKIWVMKNWKKSVDLSFELS